MALQITLVKAPGKVSVSRTSHTFREQGGTLGRGESNTWVLPDPDKFLSSCHCEILVETNQYFIVDLSTNGTFLNSSPEPLGKGVRSPLIHGDYFELGDYRFSVEVTASQSLTGASPFGAPAHTGNTTSLDDIFGLTGSSGAPFADPFSSALPSGMDFSLSPDIENTDPLLALDRAHRAADTDSNLFGNQGVFDSGIDSLIGADPLIGFSGSKQLDSSASMDQSMSWPDSSQENLIPDDWEDDLLGTKTPAQSFASGNRVDVKPLSTPAPIAMPKPVSQPKAPLRERIQNIPDVPVPHPIVQVELPQDPFPQKLPKAPEPQPVKQSSSRNPDEPDPSTSAARLNPADYRFIAAMGLDTTRLTNEQIGEICDMGGELMREIVDGMMQVLRSRTSIKNEFRMNVTTIQPVENNPLKFSVGVDEALENMFVKKSNAYKKPIEAFKEGFQEIGEHQLAMIAGIRHGFERMMERFNPETLEKNFNKQGKGGVIPGLQKAKYWSTYGDYYKGFVDNMESSFQHLFGSDFVHAYEDQLRKLAAMRKKK